MPRAKTKTPNPDSGDCGYAIAADDPTATKVVARALAHRDFADDLVLKAVAGWVRANRRHYWSRSGRDMGADLAALLGVSRATAYRRYGHVLRARHTL